MTASEVTSIIIDMMKEEKEEIIEMLQEDDWDTLTEEIYAYLTEE